MPKRSSPAMRQFRTSSQYIAKQTARTAAKSAEGLFRWAATDHSGMADAMSRMPKMGFFDTLKYTLIHLIIAVAGAILTAVWFYILLAYGLPAFLTGHF